MKVLYITTLHRTGGWLAEAFATDSASEVHLEEEVGVTAGLSRLRDEVFDAVLICHEPGVLDALDLIEALRAGGNDEPMIVLGNQPEQELIALCYEVGADAYCHVNSTTTRMLIWTVGRAIERQQLIRENHRLVQAERQRLRHEHHEAERLLQQQRSLITDLESLGENESSDVQAVGPSPPTDSGHDVGIRESSPPQPTLSPLPDRLASHYRELLRAYVIMGFGNLTEEMSALAELLAAGGVTAQQTMHLHVRVLEELIQGLGSRSARHVMNRADLLVLEVLVHLTEEYRERYHRRLSPPLQLMLPDFEHDSDHPTPSRYQP